MWIERLFISLKCVTNKPVELHIQVPDEEIENYRSSLVAMFENYGFIGALVSFAVNNSPDGSFDPPDALAKQDPESEPEPEEICDMGVLDQLPQFSRKPQFKSSVNGPDTTHQA